MKKKISFLIFTLFFLIIFLVFYEGLKNPKTYIPETRIKKIIPHFEAKIFGSQEKIDSKELFKKDKYYLINIWASWCIPCKEEHPFLMSLKKNNVEIIGINYKDNKNNAKNFLKNSGNPYKLNFSDESGILAIELGAYGVPETFLIYNNIILKKIIGPINKTSIVEIKNLIK